MFEDAFEKFQARSKRNQELLSKSTLDALAAQVKRVKESGTPAFAPQISEQLKVLHEQWKKNMGSIKSLEDLPIAKILNERYNERNQIKLMKYMSRVNEEASCRMLEDADFASPFLETDSFDAVILSLDIRRSTELMLKCESPEVYADFINTLNEELTEAVKNRYGIYDKFTGDGLLSFFPDFYSGPKAIIFALLCSLDCQQIFTTVFDGYRKYFDIGEMQTGIGVGIDTGNVFKAGEGLEYTVVGKPVVYACRFSSAPAGHVYVTDRARKLLLDVDGSSFSVTETRIPIKHEDDMLAFDVKPVHADAVEALYTLRPEWCHE